MQKQITLLTPLAFFFLMSALLSGCSTNYATVGIPAQQEFVLGEQCPGKFKVELKNMSNETVDVKAINKENGAFSQGFGLAAKGKTTVYVDKGDKVILGNASGKEIKVKAKLNRPVEGMRYQAIDK